MMMLGYRYSENEKQEIVRLYNDCMSVKEICKKYSASKSCIYNWIRDYSEVKTPSGDYVTAKKLYELEKKLSRINRENEIFRCSGCMPQSPLEQKIQAIIRLKDEFNIRVLCDTLQVRRSTVYYRLYRKPHKTQLEKEDDLLRVKIKEAYENSRGRIGSKKLRFKLMEEGFTVSVQRVSRLMKELNLPSAIRRSRRIRPSLDSPIKQNHLNQQFNQIAPNLAWASDITFINVNKTLCAICVIMDLFSRKIISYEVSDDSSCLLVLQAFHKASQQRTICPGLIFHSDQGAQYLSMEFQYLLRKNSIRQSLSRSGYPYDNAVVESFFSCLKSEELCRKVYRSIGDLTESVDDYISYYNNERPHQSFKYKTPQAVEDEYHVKKEPTTA